MNLLITKTKVIWLDRHHYRKCFVIWVNGCFNQQLIPSNIFTIHSKALTEQTNKLPAACPPLVSACPHSWAALAGDVWMDEDRLQQRGAVCGSFSRLVLALKALWTPLSAQLPQWQSGLTLNNGGPGTSQGPFRANRGSTSGGRRPWKTTSGPAALCRTSVNTSRLSH